MTARNDITGALIISMGSEKYRENYDKCFKKNNEEKKGKWIKDPSNSAKSIYVSHEKLKKSQKEREHIERVYVGGFPALHIFNAYESPTTGEIIDSPNKEREHLKIHGKRIMENVSDEVKMANNIKKQKEKEFENFIDDAVEKTANDIAYKNIEVDNGPQNLF